MDPMILFPKNISHMTMKFLDLQSIVRCSQVSKKWNELASDDILWRPWVETVFPKLLNSLPEGMNIKQYFNSCTLSTLDQTIERIKVFMQRVRENENHIFECYFPATLPLCWLKVEFGIYPENRSMKPDLHEYCIFVGDLPKPDRSLSPDKVVAHESRNMLGLESHLGILCQLTTAELTKKLSNEISDLHVPCMKELEIKHTINHAKNTFSSKKKRSRCVIA
jgi:hypothetical protein